MLNQMKYGIVSLAAIFALSACSGEKHQEEAQHEMSEQNTEESKGVDHSAMNHTSDGEIPLGLQESTNPTFPIGSKALIQANHMEGMNNVEATIVGAYDTIVYTVSYTPTTGGDPVTDHKWVIHEELEGTGEEALEPGAQATISAEHTEGMQGATAKIDSAIKSTVYMVDYISTSGEKVSNHKWVTESELSAIE